MFPKIIDLPRDLKHGMEVQALVQGYGNLKNMIKCVVVDFHEQYKEKAKNDKKANTLPNG